MPRILVVADNTYNWPSDLPAQAKSRADAVFSLGDLHKIDVSPLAATGVPVYGVYGNHDRRGYLSDTGCVDLTGDGLVGVADTPFGRMLGVTGAIRYKPHGDLLYEQQDYRDALRDMPPADIVLTHCPPMYCNDDPDDAAHLGIEALADYVDYHRPTHLFHGHTYPDNPITRFGATNIWYTYGHRWVEIG